MKVSLCFLFSCLFLINIVNGENGRFLFSDWLTNHDNLTTAEERELETKLINLMEIFLDFAEIMVQMDTKVDLMMGTEETVTVAEFEEFLASCHEIRNFLIEKKSELEKDPMNPKNWEFFDDLKEIFVKLTAFSTEMSSKIVKQSDRAKKDVGELWIASAKASELVKRLSSGTKELGFGLGFHEESGRMDELTIRTKGKVMVKMATLLITYSKHLQATADKLESLGYYLDSGSSRDEETQVGIQTQLEVMATTTENMLNLLVEAKGMMGPSNLLSYAMETAAFIKSKLPLLEERIQERHQRAMQRMTTVMEAYQALLKSIPRPSEFYKSREEL